MAPTRSNEEIGGRSYKDYAYSPVSVSSSSAVHATDTPDRKVANAVELNAVHDKQFCETALCVIATHRPESMMEKGSKLIQFLAAAAANLSVAAAGTVLGWTSPALPFLEKDGGPLGSPINSEQSSWIGSLVPLGAIIGSFISGYIGERWGRKRSLLSSVIPFLIGWILVASASQVVHLYVARLLLGIGLAFPFTILPMYCGEIAEISIRGALGSFLQLFITFGLLYTYAIGPFVSYTVFWIACAILPVFFFLCFIVMPESPYFLLTQGRRDEAIASLAKLRSKSKAAVQKEADEIQVILDEAFREQASISDLFKVKANFKATIYTCSMVVFQQFTGINVVLFYMQKIFIAAGSAIPTEQSPIVIIIVQLLASALTPLIVDKAGRKILLVFSGIGEAVSLFALGLYFYLKEVQHADDTVERISWLPLVALVVFISTYSVGWGSLPWAIMGEMFASNVKAKATGITVSVCWFLAFLITKFSNNMEKAFGNYALFWMFGASCIISVVFTVLLLPETKGKSLQEIQDELNGLTSNLDMQNATK
ncbi:hypothetical protein HN011_009732 [Eciton burchellii]|nr:hypothetical protein HN011_009732 [Eciton burchellii]